MASLAEISDVEGLWRKLDPVVEEPQISRLLLYATAIVRKRFPTIDGRIAAEELDAALVADVVASMVVRYWFSHLGEVRNETEQRLEAAQIALTQAEIDVLSPAEIGSLPHIGTIITTPSLRYCTPIGSCSELGY